VEIRSDEPKAFYYESGYRFPVTPGAPGAAIPADQMKPMTKLNVKSLLGSLSEDSGPVLLVVAVFTLGCLAAYLWGRPRTTPRSRGRHRAARSRALPRSAGSRC